MSNRQKEAARKMVRSLFDAMDRSLLDRDPVCYAHRYADRADQEVVAFLSALLAFGNVKAIHSSLMRLLQRLGASPALALKEGSIPLDPSGWETNGHRWVRGGDLCHLLRLLTSILRRYGSLEKFFFAEMPPALPVRVAIEGLVNSFSDRILALRDAGPMTRGFRYFFPAPRGGSPCKRMMLFLRWMVRPSDGVDLGLWRGLSTAHLVVPLDVHVYRFGLKYGLSAYRTPNWRFACDVTNFLKTLDPADPVKYDFVICHHGMDKGW